MARPTTAPATGGKTPIVKTKVGYVVSAGADKTAVVRVDTLSTHILYKKRVRTTKRFMVHDEENRAKLGDFVRIREGRPRSKQKSWEISEILQAAGSRAAAEQVEAEIERSDSEAEETV
jgi:small subunit ribosomal protein S17